MCELFVSHRYSEPDGWARQVILRAHAKEKKDSRLLNSLDFLLAVTDTATARDLQYLRRKGTSLGGLRPKCTVVETEQKSFLCRLK